LVDNVSAIYAIKEVQWLSVLVPKLTVSYCRITTRTTHVWSSNQPL